MRVEELEERRRLANGSLKCSAIRTAMDHLRQFALRRLSRGLQAQ
jgi:hypothetical protein